MNIIELLKLYFEWKSIIFEKLGYVPNELENIGNCFFTEGLKKDIDDFSIVLSHMIESVKKGNSITTKDVRQLLTMNIKDLNSKNNVDEVLFYGKKGPIYARSDGQKNLLKSFFKLEI